MSAFVVDRACMNRVVRVITESRRYGSRAFHRIAPLNLELDGSQECADTLGRALYALNIAAVTERYGADAAGHWPQAGGLAESYAYKRPPVQPVALRAACDGFKAVQCLAYQCSEFDADKEPPLLIALREIESELARHIVTGLPEYEAAAWG